MIETALLNINHAKAQEAEAKLKGRYVWQNYDRSNFGLVQNVIACRGFENVIVDDLHYLEKKDERNGQRTYVRKGGRNHQWPLDEIVLIEEEYSKKLTEAAEKSIPLY